MENEEKQSGIKRTLKRIRNRKRYGDTAHKQEKEKKHIKKKEKEEEKANGTGSNRKQRN